MKKVLLILLAVGLLALGGCGGDDGGSDSGSEQDAQGAAAEGTTGEEAARETGRESQNEEKEEKPTGTRIVLRDSEFGTMLFDSKNQAIYIFERDERNRSNCYGECAVAWPPVFTEGEPRAGKGVDQSLLGTTRRRDGKRQVTYAGKPLYFYVNEAPGEVRCHNVNLNGGFWWVVGPDGERRA